MSISSAMKRLQIAISERDDVDEDGERSEKNVVTGRAEKKFKDP